MIATASGGGTTIGAGHIVITGVGSSGPALVSDFPLGQRISITPGILSLPPGALDAIGGGPALVRGGQAITNAGEGFTGSQVGRAHGSRSAVGQTADGTTMFVTVEGPQQGRPGMTAADQARLMQSLGAVTAIATDAGGSAQLAVRNQLVIPWGSAPRALADVVVMSYDGVTVEPLPYRVSANNDRVDDTRLGRVPRDPPRRDQGEHRAQHRTAGARPVAGQPRPRQRPRHRRPQDAALRRRALRRGGHPHGGGRQRRHRGAPQGDLRPHASARSPTRPATRKVGKKTVPRLDVGFRLARTARVTVRIRSTSGTPIATVASGRRLKAGPQRLSWDRMVRGKVVSGTVQVTAESRTSYGTSGLVRSVTLKAPPAPKKASPKKP